MPRYKVQRLQAVTLVEVLVAVAIIGLLLALTIGGLQKFTEVGDRAKCVFNLKQLHVAFHGYLADHNQILPDKNPKRLWPYAGLPEGGVYQETIYTCPALQRNPATASVDVNYRTYAINLYATTEKLLKDTDHYMRIEQPTKMLLFTEGKLQGNPDITNPLGRSGKWYMSNVRLEHIDEIFFPHQGHQNAVFVDGSVRAIGREEFYQGGKWNTPFWRGY